MLTERDPEVIIIDLNPPHECYFCERDAARGCGVPIYEDLILHNDYVGDWGGVSVCRETFDWQEKLTAPASMRDAPCYRSAVMDFHEAARLAALELREVRAETYQAHRCVKSGRCDAHIEDHLAELDQICEALERGVRDGL